MYNIGNPTGGNFDWYDYQVPVDSVFAVSKRLIVNPDVIDVVIPSYGTFNAVPNDPNYSLQQWYFDESEAHPTIKIDPAWDITTGDPNVRIAVLDAGIDWEHTDFGPGTDGYDNIFRNNGEEPWNQTGTPVDGDGIDSDGNGFIDDWMGWDFHDNDNDIRNSNSMDEHGLNVAGVIGAKTNNNNNIAGVAGGWKTPSGTANKGCELIICRIGDSQSNDAFKELDLRDGIAYAIENGADIINLSISLPDANAFVTDAIKAAYDEGITIISSSGNTNAPLVTYPASLPEVIAVGATDWNDQRWEESSLGSSYGPELDLSAPGVNIEVLVTSSPYVTHINDKGTSFSTPLVSGVAGLMKSVNPCLGPEQIRNILANTADKVGGYYYNPPFHKKPLHSKELGYGRLNAQAAVQMALDVHSATPDLYMKDRFEDMGINSSAYPVDDSPDIWVRNIDDDKTEHENPVYSSGHTIAYVYVRVRNKSCITSNNMTLSVYYTSAATGSSWQSDFVKIGQTEILPSIDAGGT